MALPRVPTAFALVLPLMVAFARPGLARSRQVPPVVAGAKPVTVEHIQVHGAALEGNLEGDAVDRDVFVFLPPSYATERNRRYPVVYALHGYSIGAEQWTHEIHVPQTIEGAFAQGAQRDDRRAARLQDAAQRLDVFELVTTGDFERFISHDVVAYIDAHYRTIPDRRSRGLVGHSMGGYGATRIGMKHRRRVRQPLHHEPLLPLAARGPRPANPEAKAAAGGGEDARADLAKLCLLRARPAGHRGGLVAQPEESAALSRPAGRRTASRGRRSWRSGRPMRRWRSWTSTSATCGSTGELRWTSATRTVCRSTPASCTKRWTLRHRQQLRDLFRHAHQRRGRPLPESRAAVLQRAPLRHGAAQR